MRNHLLAGIFASVAILVLGLVGEITGFTVLIAPFGASCVLLFGFPDSPLVKTKNLVGGHILSATVGLIFLSFTSESLEMMAVAVGVSVSLMLITRTSHPAAGANPIIIMATKANWLFIFFPIFSGVLILLFVSLLHRKLLERSL